VIRGFSSTQLHHQPNLPPPVDKHHRRLQPPDRPKGKDMNSEKLANYAPSHFKFSPDDSYLTYLHTASHQV
jgi:hypothetical protein